MQGSKSDSFVKSQKKNKGFDDGYKGRQDNKKHSYHKNARYQGNKNRDLT